MQTQKKPWAQSMPAEQFELMRDILGAPSPVGLEGAMTQGVIVPYYQSFMPDNWHIHQFIGNAGVVLDTHPGQDDMFSVMIIGHADKIRMQVRSIGEDGKIWIDSDSFLPQTLVGHEVLIFSEDPKSPGSYRTLQGCTIEAVGAIHFAEPAMRSGDVGIKKEHLYVSLHIHGDNKKEQVTNLGVRPGDSIILDRKIKRGFSPDTFYGAYLDNGLGCFTTAEVARLVADNGGLDNVRLLFTVTTMEEIGRMGSRVMAGKFRPDVVIGVDVNHDYVAAPNVSNKRFAPVEMGKGFTISVGSVASEYLNTLFEKAANKYDIPIQRDVVGRDTGTDAMAAVLAGVDAAATSIGFSIRNMHTISEAGHTGDVLASIYGIYYTLKEMNEMNDGQGITAQDFFSGHPRLDNAVNLDHPGFDSDNK